MYVRFVSSFPDWHTGRPMGVFMAARFIRDSAETPGYVIDLLREHMDWFDINLDRPMRLSKSTRPYAIEIAQCWFLPSAFEHIERARELAALLSEYTFPVSMITTRRPGVIVYRDAVQIAAIPFRR